MKLTQKWVDALEATDKRETFRCDEQSGFGVRCEPIAAGGRVSYFWNAKVNGKVHYKSLGERSTVSLKDARYDASVLAGKARDWKQAGCIPADNPFIEKPDAVEHVAPTFRQLVEHYVKNHLWNPAAGINHPDRAEKNLRWSLKYFADWMDRTVDSITVADVVKLRDSTPKAPYTANRNVQLARSLFAYCSGGKDGKINVWPLPSNPTATVVLNPEIERDRYLTSEEQDTLEEALKDERTPRDLADFVLLSITTGARKMSLLLAEWTEFDFGHRQWKIPAEHSKSGESYIVSLLPEAIKILEQRHKDRTTHPFVFPPVSGAYLHLDKPFRRLMVRIAAEYRRDHKGEASTLETKPVNIHDLRRTKGAVMAQNAASLEQIAQALGQESVSATGIYARLNQESVRKASEKANQERRKEMAVARKRREAREHVAVIGGAR